MLYIIGSIGILFNAIGLWMGICLFIGFWKINKIHKVFLIIIFLGWIITLYYGTTNLLHTCFGFTSLPLTKISSRYGW